MTPTALKRICFLSIFLLSAQAPQMARCAPTLAKTTVSPSPSSPAMNEVFPIGVWYDGRVEGINCPAGYVDVPRDLGQARAYYEKTFADIKRHGIEIIAIPNTPPAYRETLLAAQREPEQHRDLIVRIGGYSEYFVTLPKELQETVIARTEHRL